MFGTHSYVIQGELKRTRYHVLYKAKNMATDGIVLIKAIDAKWKKLDEIKRNLLAEAKLGQALEHRNICRSIAVFEEEDSVYYVREYVEGTNLKEYLEANRYAIDTSTGLGILKGILSALDYAHGKGIVHRNLNPENILIDDNGDVKITGFGKPKGAWLKEDSGNNIWHPIYSVAPEVYLEDKVYALSDIYSLGVIAYILFTKRLPWSLSSGASVLQQKQDSFKRPVQNPEFFGDRIAPWLFSVINKCLMIDMGLRIQSCAELIQALQNERSYPFEPANKMSGLSFIPKTVSTSLPSIETTSQDIELPTNPEHSIIEPIEEETNITQSHDLPTLPEEQEEGIEIKKEESIPAHSIDEIEDFSTLEDQVEAADAPIITPELEVPASISELHVSADIPEDELPEDFGTLLSEDAPVKAERIENLDVEVSAKEVTDEAPPTITKTIVPKPIEQEASKDSIKPPYIAEERKPLEKAKEPKQVIEDDSEDEESMINLKKTFKVILLLSVGVLIFVILKYFVFTDRPRFETIEKDTEELTTEKLVKIPNDAISMVTIPADTVIVGSMAADADADEFPIKQVRLRSFLIGKTEVTQREWMMVFGKNPSRFQDDGYPVENVSFYDVIDFCNEKSLLDGLTPCYSFVGDEIVCDFNANGYRLPTEAEWEHAAKGGKRDAFYTFSGSDNPSEAGWYNENSGAAPQKVSRKKANAFGLYDMSGNVFEWVWNWYSAYSYRMNDVYAGSETGTDKVIRGGSWYHDAHEMRVTNRNFAKPYTRANYIGFRVVRSN